MVWEGISGHFLNKTEIGIFLSSIVSCLICNFIVNKYLIKHKNNLTKTSYYSIFGCLKASFKYC